MIQVRIKIKTLILSIDLKVVVAKNQKRSLFTNLRPIKGLFKTSYIKRPIILLAFFAQGGALTNKIHQIFLFPRYDNTPIESCGRVI
jgi:hypothetical protein